MNTPTAYLDSTVLKFSATALRAWFPTPKTVQWGPDTITMNVYSEGRYNPNDNITNPELRAEADLLPKVAAHAKAGALTCVMQMETELEVEGLPTMGPIESPFHGATIGSVDAPFRYGRVTNEAFRSAGQMQYEFLSRIDHPRFLELCKITGEAKPVMEDLEELRQRLLVANRAHEEFLIARQKA